jgi:Cu(I)/Ag(I) efflux system membrane fusion protein
MKNSKFSNRAILQTLLILAIGFLVGWLIKPGESDAADGDNTAASEMMDQPTTWTCSMHPQIRQQEPGDCPLCGMDLIPLEDEMGQEDPLEIRMSQTAMALANVQTEIIGLGKAMKEVRVNGKVQADERLIFSQVTHLDGRVEELKINFTGESIRQGQQIASIYSPDLVTAQEELFAAEKIKATQPGLYRAAQEKLKNWKLTEEQIEQIIAEGKARERFPILSDVSGIVMKKLVNLGDYVSRGMPLYEIVDLSRVWVLFDAYESDLSWVKVGSKVEFTLPSYPGEKFEGRISFIDPVINPATRVATARVEMRNRGGKLKPEMFVSGVVKTAMTAKDESMIIPKSAVMWTGTRSIVYEKFETDAGVSFFMREVELGPLLGDGYISKAGLKPGAEIAVNGTFSIDAAAQLAGKPSMMNQFVGKRKGPGLPDFTDVTPASFKSQLAAVANRYLVLKDALVATDPAKAAGAAKGMLGAIDKVDMSLLEGDVHMYWMDRLRALKSHTEKIADLEKVEEQRKQFDFLSQVLINTIKVFGISEGKFFVQHCPMANNDKGADWLSDAKEIRNPYFGDVMLTCGMVQDTITKDYKIKSDKGISEASPATGHRH